MIKLNLCFLNYSTISEVGNDILTLCRAWKLMFCNSIHFNSFDTDGLFHHKEQAATVKCLQCQREMLLSPFSLKGRKH